MIAAFIWDPDRNFFVIPYINHPVTWYGFLFALGFLVSYLMVRKLFAIFLEDPLKKPAEVQAEAVQSVDRLTALVIVGTILGARLGEVFFYSWDYYKANPLDIFKIWEGGLASHGGVVGVFIGILVFLWIQKRTLPQFTFFSVLDAVVIPGALVGGCIRIGNFINQEITGLPTTKPWGIAFLHPMDGYPGVPVHPVQLYEALFNFGTFFFLFFLWLGIGKRIGSGLLTGCFFFFVFTFRFFIEYLKVPQTAFDTEGFLRMGQLLSLPFIAFGLIMIIFGIRRLRTTILH